MKKTFSIISFFILLTFSLLNVNSCGSREDTVSCFPNSPISLSLNLNLPDYFILTQIGNWKYINVTGSGTRGLIIYRRSNTQFQIYDRNAPHLCPDNDTTLEVKDNIYIFCPKDNTKWNITNGQPENGSPTSLPPKTYTLYNFDPTNNILTISN